MAALNTYFIYNTVYPNDKEMNVRQIFITALVEQEISGCLMMLQARNKVIISVVKDIRFCQHLPQSLSTDQPSGSSREK
jgi:hypothetical protein